MAQGTNLLSTLILVLGVLGLGEAIFDRPDSNEFPLLNTISCEPRSRTIIAPLQPGDLSAAWLPIPSRYQVPDDLTLTPNDQVVLMGFLGTDFDSSVQSLILPPGNASAVCRNGTQLEGDDEGIRPSDIPDVFQARYFEENLNDTVRYAIHTSDNRRAMARTFRFIDCRVVYIWTDAGANFFPRYYSAGTCFGRRCSIPDQGDFLCRPDVFNEKTMGEIVALRWDCCWRVITVRLGRRRGFRRVFDCGWRRVRIPIVCDCDCSCPGRNLRIS